MGKLLQGCQGRPPISGLPPASVKLYAPLDTANHKFARGSGLAEFHFGTLYSFDMAGVYRNLAAVNAFQIACSSGNFSSGVVRCYGVAK